MNNVAQAIHVIQTTTGCRVALIPMGADSVAEALQTAILKPSESTSGVTKVSGAVSAESPQKPAKRTRKVTRPIKEKVSTFMTVPKFAELKECSTVTVYGAIKRGAIPAEMVNKTTGNILVDSRTEWEASKLPHKGVKVFCKETKMTFDSIAQAAKATGLAYTAIIKSLDKGIMTHKGLSFTRV